MAKRLSFLTCICTDFSTPKSSLHSLCNINKIVCKIDAKAAFTWAKNGPLFSSNLGNLLHTGTKFKGGKLCARSKQRKQLWWNLLPTRFFFFHVWFFYLLSPFFLLCLCTFVTDAVSTFRLEIQSGYRDKIVRRYDAYSILCTIYIPRFDQWIGWRGGKTINATFFSFPRVRQREEDRSLSFNSRAF